VLEVGDQGVLPFRSAVGEVVTEALLRGTVKRLQPEAVVLDPISIRPDQCTIDVRDGPNLLRARTILVGGEDALEERRGRTRLVRAQCR
jgi:hypothetical protein